MSGLSRKSITIAIIVIVAAVGIGYFFMTRNKAPSDKAKNQEVFPTSTFEELSPTVEQTLNKEDIKVKVLNGSGVVGEANRVKLILEDNEFTVSETGNADSYEADETTIAAKAGVSGSALSELKKILEKDYTVTASSLDAGESVDVVITVGDRINAPTTKPTASDDNDITVTASSPTPSKSPTPTTGT